MIGIFKKIFTWGGATRGNPAPPLADVAGRPGLERHMAAEKPSLRADEPPLDSAFSSAYLTIPLKELLAVLPEPLRAQRLLSGSLEVTVSLPLAEVMPQLARGLVRIPFGLIKKGSPAGTFAASNGLDGISVTLPLSLVLTHLNPQVLNRRPDQKVVSVPAEIAPVFNVQPQPSAPTGDMAIHQLRPEPVQQLTSRPGVLAPSREFTSAPAMPEAGGRVVTSPARELANPPAVRPAPVFQPPPAPVPPPVQPAIAVERASVPVPVPTTPPLERPSSPAETAAPLEVPLGQFIGAFPAEISALLNGIAAAARLEIPWSEAELGMKQGRMLIPWERLRNWIRPTPADSGHLVNPQVEISLPLPLLVPLFLSRTAKARPQKRVQVADNIPDVFSGKSSPSAAPVASFQPSPASGPSMQAAPAPPVSAPAMPGSYVVPSPQAPPSMPLAAPAAAPASVPLASLPTDPAPVDLGQLFGQPGKTVWTPMELVQHVSRLPGMSGALIALPDGLLVTSEVPAGMEGEVIAAFLPQMFGRMNHYMKELKLGDLATLRFGAGPYTLLVYRLPDLYFLALGRAGMALPEPQLTAVAAQLARQSKS